MLPAEMRIQPLMWPLGCLAVKFTFKIKEATPFRGGFTQFKRNFAHLEIFFHKNDHTIIREQRHCFLVVLFWEKEDFL